MEVFLPSEKASVPASIIVRLATDEDVELLHRFAEFERLGYPLLLASSRKSFMGRVFNLPAGDLLAPSLATAALGWYGGARIFRVHDVAETVRFLHMLAAVRPGRREGLQIAPEMPR